MTFCGNCGRVLPQDNSQSCPGCGPTSSTKQVDTTLETTWISLAQREDEFERDAIFEEYITEKFRQNAVPHTWQIFQTSRRKAFMWGLLGAVIVPAITLIVVAAVVQGANVPPSFWWALVAGCVIAGSLVYGSIWLYWFTPNKTLVLTPNGCICFEWGAPRHMIRFSRTKRITYNKISQYCLTAETSLVNINITLGSFDIPDTIAQQIDHAYQDFLKKSQS